HGLLPGQTVGQAMDALLEYGANALLVSGVPGDSQQREYLLRDENGQSVRWASHSGEPVMDSDALLATAVTCELARGGDMVQAIDRSLAVTGAMADRSFKPGMGGRIFDRSRSCPKTNYAFPEACMACRLNGRIPSECLPHCPLPRQVGGAPSSGGATLAHR